MPAFQVRVCILLALLIPAALVLVFVPPVAQPLWYHDFADQRPLLYVPHALNVISNLAFVLVGAWGLWYLLRKRRSDAFRLSGERWPYVAFFAAIALTGIGSAYYHWHPDNNRLLWDRLPLAVAFMTLFAIIVAERVHPRAGRWLFLPLVVAGAGSVVYWHATELHGQGDLRPYLVVQLYPLILVPGILLLFPARYTRTSDLYGALVWYAVAKLLELLDRQVYGLGGVISGHTLKHLVAAASAYLILHMLQRRQPLPPPGCDMEGTTRVPRPELEMKRDVVALAVAMLVPSLMTWFEFTVLPGEEATPKPVLQWFFGLGKAAQFLFPAVYVWCVDRGQFAPSWPSARSLAFATGIGLLVGIGALILYFLFLRGTPLMSQTGGLLVRWLEEYHLATPLGYWSMALAMVTLHAFLEEYYWRWFVFRWLHRHTTLAWATVLSSLGFMLHHVVILSIYLPGYFWLGVMPFSLCVAVGGVIWALLYHSCRALYPVWLSHGLVDLSLMCVGWDLVLQSW